MKSVMKVREVGAFIRSQRLSSRLSLRKLSGLAGVSIPYLSQVERGLRKPSADILQAIAKALRISAETLYVQAGILDDRALPDLATAIMSDPTISERQKQALVQIYEAFQEETARAVPARGRAKAAARRPIAAATAAPARTPTRSAGAGSAGSRSKHGGGAKTQAGNSPHPAPLRATNRGKEG
jgi:transcriptional regulator with XRE-family HTH domain